MIVNDAKVREAFNILYSQYELLWNEHIKVRAYKKQDRNYTKSKKEALDKETKAISEALASLRRLVRW